MIVSTHSGVVPSACWVFGLGRIRDPAAFARVDTTKLSCGEKVEHALDQERRLLRIVGRR